MRNTLICLIASTLLVPPLGRAQSSPIDDFDFKTAEQHLKDLHVPQRTLFEAEQGPDGTRGYGLPNPTAYRVAVPTQDPPFGARSNGTRFSRIADGTPLFWRQIGVLSCLTAP